MNKNIMTNLVVPELGEGIVNATVAFWHVKVGDVIKEGDDVIELVTDKATFNVPVSVSGTVVEILVPEGTVAKIGQVLAILN